MKEFSALLNSVSRSGEEEEEDNSVAQQGSKPQLSNDQKSRVGAIHEAAFLFGGSPRIEKR